MVEGKKMNNWGNYRRMKNGGSMMEEDERMRKPKELSNNRRHKDIDINGYKKNI